MARTSLWKVAGAALLAGMLTGCGGGMGGGSNPAPGGNPGPGSGGGTPGTGGGGTPGATITDAQRTAALNDLTTALGTLTTTDRAQIGQQMLAYFQKHPIYEASGVEDDGSIWARFTDGRLVSIMNNRDAGSDDEAPVPAASRSRAATIQGTVPASTKASFLDGYGPLSNPYGQVVQMATGNGYVPLSTPGYNNVKLESLKATQNCGLLFFSGHSGRGRLRDMQVRFIAFTRSHRTEATDAANKADLDDGTLCYCYLHHVKTTGTNIWKEAPDYAFTAKFVQKYMTFSQNSLVVMDSCTSDSPDIRAAFLAKGASAYVGWSNVVRTDCSLSSVPFFFDRLLGANAADPKETPPQRAFDYVAVLGDMTKRGLIQYTIPDPDYPSKMVQTKFSYTAGQGYFGQLAPGIQGLMVDELSGVLHVVGEFGDDPGFVVMNDTPDQQGTPLQIKAWTPTDITCVLPATGPGSSGSVTVIVNNHHSNAVPLTEWRGTFRYTVHDQGTLTEQFTFNLHFRGDVHAYRNAPGGPVLNVGVPLQLAPDSTCQYSASGNWSDGYGTTVDWSGGTTIKPAYLVTPGQSCITFDGGIENGKVTLGVVASILNEKIEHTVKTVNGTVVENTTAHTGSGATFSGAFANEQSGGLVVAMSDGFVIPSGKYTLAGSSEYGGTNNQTATLEWSEITPINAPDGQSPRAALKPRR